MCLLHLWNICKIQNDHDIIIFISHRVNDTYIYIMKIMVRVQTNNSLGFSGTGVQSQSRFLTLLLTRQRKKPSHTPTHTVLWCLLESCHDSGMELVIDNYVTSHVTRILGFCLLIIAVTLRKSCHSCARQVPGVKLPHIITILYSNRFSRFLLLGDFC